MSMMLSDCGLTDALRAGDSSARMRTAMMAGTHPDVAYLEPLIARLAVEPDFYVREMLTWALTRLPHAAVLPRVVEELSASSGQARSQALHTISKLGDASAWTAITADHLHDRDDEVARAAWRAAGSIVPDEDRRRLAVELVRELGRGDFEVMRSLSRALIELGEAARPLLEQVRDSSCPLTEEDASLRSRRQWLAALHAQATLRMLDDPSASFSLEFAEDCVAR